MKKFLAGVSGLALVGGAVMVLSPGQPPSPRPVTLQWQCDAIQPGEITGVKSSTNLRDWQLECQFAASPTNQWTDTNTMATAEFYRAFTALP